MKVVKKLLAPVLVVGLLLTSLVTLHHLKDAKKDNVFRIGISQYITHKSLDATRKGFIDELKKEGYVDGKNIQIDFQNAQGEQRNLKNISKQLAEVSLTQSSKKIMRRRSLKLKAIKWLKKQFSIVTM